MHDRVAGGRTARPKRARANETNGEEKRRESLLGAGLVCMAGPSGVPYGTASEVASVQTKQIILV